MHEVSHGSRCGCGGDKCKPPVQAGNATLLRGDALKNISRMMDGLGPKSVSFMHQVGVFDEMFAERAGRDATRDDEKNEDDWVGAIAGHCDGGRDMTLDFRTQMIRVAVVCLAAIESYDRKASKGV
jgi:hypothetical protein